MNVDYGLSEPNVGGDLASVETRAERQGDAIIINGVKLGPIEKTLTNGRKIIRFRTEATIEAIRKIMENR